jgi:hypothetical protein
MDQQVRAMTDAFGPTAAASTGDSAMESFHHHQITKLSHGIFCLLSIWDFKPDSGSFDVGLTSA